MLSSRHAESEPLTRRRAVDLVRVAAALCRTTG
ncbi:putative leader peptide [Streptomyces sp. BF23-18]